MIAGGASVVGFVVDEGSLVMARVSVVGGQWVSVLDVLSVFFLNMVYVRKVV